MTKFYLFTIYLIFFLEVNTYAAVEPTTTTTTTTTTTESTTTTQTTTTTTESTTTTTEDPGLLGRVGIIVNNGFGGVINGLANAANSLTSVRYLFLDSLKKIGASKFINSLSV